MSALHLATNCVPWSDAKWNGQPMSQTQLGFYILSHSHTIPSYLPAWLAHVVSQCISREPGGRLTCSQFAQYLETVRQEDALAENPSSTEDDKAHTKPATSFPPGPADSEIATLKSPGILGIPTGEKEENMDHAHGGFIPMLF